MWRRREKTGTALYDESGCKYGYDKKEPGLRLPASASLPLASCWPRPQQLLPVSATGGGRRRCKWLDGWLKGRKH